MKKFSDLKSYYGWGGVIVVATLLFWQDVQQLLPSSAQQVVKKAKTSPSGTIADNNKPSLKPNQSNHFSRLTSPTVELELPHSLKHTTVDGHFPVDENGHLIPSQAIKERFDYFLSIIGEESLDQVIARITANINQQLTPPAREEAHQLLTRYLDYKIALTDYEQLLADNLLGQQQRPLLQLFEQYQEALNSLRLQYFSSMIVEAFFGFDQQYSDWVRQRLAISSDTSLSEPEKAAAMEHFLPVDLQEVFAPNKQEVEVKSIVDQLNQQGATSDIIYSARAEIVGEAAASRLAQLDQAKAQWQQRLQQFRQAYQSLAAQQLPQAELQLAVSALLNQQFTDQEQLRVKVLAQLPDTFFTSPE
ncbi:lipase secretion chaperone [Spartinivicinus ruber]|uniref:lipase secretion chaperone n=1 Tax=Spartinivicinus ruber TaxID=2683272 RepID=UPI0013D0CB44|nr:lipase secretion chaperone [Spartinivicinus ruber]